MILVLAASVAAAPILDEATRALAAGRPMQAREMIATAVQNGAAGTAVDRPLADLAFAEGDWPGALARYKLLLHAEPDSGTLLEKAGLAALRSGALDEAIAYLDRAVAQPTAGWRAWDARAVAADWQRDWATADQAYARAEGLAPDSALVLNNHGWSLLLRGEWTSASQVLARATALAPANRRIAANLDLARSAASQILPARRPGESNSAYAIRLNDAGVLAAKAGDRAKAMAAFARALDASDHWFARAANNLAFMDSVQ